MAEICNPEDIEKREESSEFPSPVSEPQIAYVYDEEKLQAVQTERPAGSVFAAADE